MSCSNLGKGSHYAFNDMMACIPSYAYSAAKTYIAHKTGLGKRTPACVREAAYQGGVRPGADKTYGKYKKAKVNRRFRLSVLKAVQCPISYHNVTTQQTNGTTGTTTFDMCTLNSVSDIKSFMIRPTDLSYAGANNQARVMLEESNMEVQMSNMTNSVMHIRFYWCTLRKPATLASVTKAHLFDFSDLHAAAAGSSETASDLAVTIFQNPRFCEYFKIDKQKLVALAPGQQVDMTVHYNKTRQFNYEYVNSLITGGQVELGGFLKLLVWQIWGGIETDATDPTQISLTPPKVNSIIKKRYVGYPIPDIGGDDTSYDQSLGAIVSGQFIDEETGANIGLVID